MTDEIIDEIIIKEKTQELVGIDRATKELLDNVYKIKGFSTRGKYIKSLIQRDNV